MSVLPPPACAPTEAELDLFGMIHIMAPGIDVPGGPGDDTLSGSADDDTIEGFGGFDILSGLAGDDTIDGGDEDDTLIGGAGADHLIGGTGSDVASYEDATSGVTVNLADPTANTGDAAGDSYDSIENLLGSGLDDVLVGDAGVNFFEGGEGKDTITGGDGDLISGGNGDDDLTFTGGAVLAVFGGRDNDILHVTGDTTSGLGVVEVESCDIAAGVSAEVDGSNDMSFTLLGAATLIAGSSDDTITGSSGDDVIDGGIGADSILGGDGNDLFKSTGGTDSFDGEGGIDTLSFAGAAFAVSVDLLSHLVSNDGTGSGFNESITGVENLIGGDHGNTLRGDGANNSITGGAAFDILQGRDGDDTLDSGGGGDSLTGGNGNDVYYVHNSGDAIIEGSGATSGTDLVYSTVSYVLANNVENLVLVAGSAAFFAIGNGSANQITGNEGGNSIDGGAGDDTLDGGQGADEMDGGADNDTYYVDNGSDTIFEASGAGTDTVRSSVTFSLSNEVENLVLVAGAGAIHGFGNGSANQITGNESGNSIDGGAGDDTIDGGLGADTMGGGADNDTYYVDNNGDVVSEGSAGGTDTVRATITYTLGANIENLVLAAGAGDLSGAGNDDTNDITGNEGNNSLSGGGSFDFLHGGAGADTLDGGTGDDSLSGGDGNDVFYIDSNSDAVIEGSGAESGTDLVYSSLVGYALGSNVENLVLLAGTAAQTGAGNGSANAITGNENDNSLLGAAGDDTLDGGLGADSMYGGADNDTFVVDSISDVVDDTGGTDTVRASINYALASNIEDLVLISGAGDLTGTGNGSANHITGNEGDNSIDGGGGADTMTGGDGDDTYVVDNAGDRVVEAFGEGTDTVQASISYTLAALVEDLELTGSAGLKGTGNKLDNQITGTTGDDSLYGGGGADTLKGGDGDDVYTVKDSSVVIVENDGEGRDLVRATVNYTLGDGIERLTLTGGVGLSGTGNGGANTILGTAAGDTLDGSGGDDLLKGKDGDDHLTGGAGQDRMNGGDGADTFVFLGGDSPEATPDRILDFEAGTDHIDLSGLDDHAGALHFSGGRHLTGEAGQVIAVVGHAATFVEVDLDGDGSSDLTIALRQAPTLTGADFVF